MPVHDSLKKIGKELIKATIPGSSALLFNERSAIDDVRLPAAGALIGGAVAGPAGARIGAGGGAIVAGAAPSEAEQRQQEGIEKAIDRRDALTERLEMISRGDFEGAGVEGAFRQRLDPQLNEAAALASQRGIHGPAREQILQETESRARADFQLAALGLQSGSLQAAENFLLQLPQEDLSGFFQDISDIVQSGFTEIFKDDSLYNLALERVFGDFGGSDAIMDLAQFTGGGTAAEPLGTDALEPARFTPL